MTFAATVKQRTRTNVAVCSSAEPIPKMISAP
jgi:hypothetical protein